MPVYPGAFQNPGDGRRLIGDRMTPAAGGANLAVTGSGGTRELRAQHYY
jgi:hypothetical protein